MKFNKQIAIAVMFVVLVAALALLGACSNRDENIEGKLQLTFQFNGGILDNGATNLQDSVNHACEKNSYVVDIATFPGFKFTRSGYVFEGWFRDKELTDAWDFSKDRITADTTLYAKWRPDIVYTYGVYLVVEGKENELLGRYTVEQGEKFVDKRNYGTNLRSKKRTFERFCSDPALTTPWDDNFVHPGGAVSTEIPVYVQSIDGVWQFVSDYEQLLAAIKTSDSIWLKDNIDCGGKDLYFDTFNAELKGDNHKIFNFNVESFAGTMQVAPQYSIFNQLNAKANIHDVTFEGAHFALADSAISYKLAIAGLAQRVANGAKITNVHVRGTFDSSQLKFVFTATATNVTSDDDIAQLFAQLSFEEYKDHEVTVQNFDSQITKQGN